MHLTAETPESGLVELLRFGSLERLYALSAFSPKADMVQRHRDVRFVPEADIQDAGIHELFSALGKVN